MNNVTVSCDQRDVDSGNQTLPLQEKKVVLSSEPYHQ